MDMKVFAGADAEALVLSQISQHSSGIEVTLARYSARSAVSAWMEVLRGVEELINIPQFELEDEQRVQALRSLPMQSLTPQLIESLQNLLAARFTSGVAHRFIYILLRSAAIIPTFQQSGLVRDLDFRTLDDVIDYFQSRRRQMVALLYWMPNACSGSELVDEFDAMNIFLPIVEYSCVNLSTFYRDLVLLRIYPNFVITTNDVACERSETYDLLDQSSLEPERVGITEVSRKNIDPSILINRMKVDPRRVFSVPELCNNLLEMEATFAEFKLGETAFGTMCRFIVACAQNSRDEYYIELNSREFRDLIKLCGISTSVQRCLVYSGENYATAINSFSPFIDLKNSFLTTVPLLIRFAYNYKTICLNKIKRFQIRSGYLFEDQVKSILAEQGLILSGIKRIDHKEFDVVATKDGIIYNIQCKNNLIDITRIETNPVLFSRYNKRLERYYEKSLIKEENREELLKKTLGLQRVKHIILSKFPLATKNPQILAFREIREFSVRYCEMQC